MNDRHFSSCEVVELGIQIEKNGRDFYSALAGSTRNARAAEIFKYLAGEEEKHIAVFREIFNTSCKYEPEGAYPEDYFSYMNTLASEHVFTQKDKGKELAQNIESDIKAVELSIKFEEESVAFYENMKKVIPAREEGTIDRLIKEEESHIKKLSDVKKILES